MKKVSVIIPVYNCEDFVSDAIGSVLRQTYKNFEIIVIDDGSTDNTQDILKKYDDEIKYIFQDNGGVAAARNTGLGNTTGDYIAFLDADDIWFPQKLEKQIKVLENNPDYGFVYCDNYFVDEDKNILRNYVREVKLVEGDILLDLFLDFFLITSGIVMRRKCLDAIRYFNENLPVGEDFEFFLRLCKHYRTGVVKEKLFKRRVWENSLSRGNFMRSKLIDIKTLKDFLKNNPDFYDKHKTLADKRIAELYFKLGYYLEQNHNKLTATENFLKSLSIHWNFSSIKGLLKALVPFSIKKNKVQ